MKKKKKIVLQIFSLILSTVLIIAFPSAAMAKETDNEKNLYYDTEQGRVVSDIEGYLNLLNNNEITPFDSTITTNRFAVTTFDLSEPSQKCSNIFGHKWGNWGSWYEVSRINYNNGNCYVIMERWRFCKRTFCSAHQIESDGVWLKN